jgi:hypothetical protein
MFSDFVEEKREKRKTNKQANKQKKKMEIQVCPHQPCLVVSCVLYFCPLGCGGLGLAGI